MPVVSEPFRILVVDDSPASANIVVEELTQAFGDGALSFVVATSFDEATIEFRRRCIDFVLTDYNLGQSDPQGGLRVIEFLVTLNANIDCALYTKHFREQGFLVSVLGTLARVSRSKVRVTGVANIGQDIAPLISTVRVSLDLWTKRHIDVVDELGIGAILLSQGIGTWIDETEAYADFLRLTNAIYGNAAIGNRPVKFRLKIRNSAGAEIDRGHSGAIVLTPAIEFANSAKDDASVITVLKVGQPEPMQTERDRFRNLVAFGFPLRSRVEFLGFTRRHSLAGLCYGFAGGILGDRVLSLRRDLANPGGAMRAQAAVRELFSSSNRFWYGHRLMERVNQTRYVAQSNRRPIDDMVNLVTDRLHALRVGPGEIVTKMTIATQPPEVTRLSIGSAKLVFPERSIAGSLLTRTPSPQTLIHGDLHLGNVLLELREAPTPGVAQVERAVLIDFANAGTGPRTDDLATLYSDTAREMAHQYPRSSDCGNNSRTISQCLATAFRADRELLQSAFDLRDPTNPFVAELVEPGEWAGEFDDSRLPTVLAQEQRLHREIVVGLHRSFGSELDGSKSDEPVRFQEFSASLFVRSIELAIHEPELPAFLRLIGIAAVIRGLIPDELLH